MRSRIRNMSVNRALLPEIQLFKLFCYSVRFVSDLEPIKIHVDINAFERTRVMRRRLLILHVLLQPSRKSVSVILFLNFPQNNIF